MRADPNDRAPVAKMPSDLPLDVAPDIGRQRACALRVATVDGDDQPDRADLNQILEAFAPAGKTGGDVPDERQVIFDQAATCGFVSKLETHHGGRIACGTLHLGAQHKPIYEKDQSSFSFRVLMS